MVLVKARWSMTDAFDNTEIDLSCEIGNGIGGLTPLNGACEVIEATVHHFYTDPIQGKAFDFGDLIAEIKQHGIEQPGGPDLHLDSIGGSRPEIRQAQESFHKGKRLFNTPFGVLCAIVRDTELQRPGRRGWWD